MFRRKAAPNPLEASFHEEAMPHADALFGAAMRLTRSRRDAEDLVQDTLLKAYKHFDKYKAGTNCKAWLFRIQTNTFINSYRKRQRQRVFSVDEDRGRPLAERISVVPQSELEYRKESATENVERLFGDEVGQALRGVPVDFRMVVLYADVYDFSYKECAEILEIPIGTVMSRLYRGRRLLRAQLAEYALEQGVVREIGEDYRNQVETDRGNVVSLDAKRRAHA
ncbi:MAG: RNA polymerase sigma-70 factor (ECF subfamily) [Bradymonadia bacterium]|jgi:RNA polymerase sigma-70 factor (ECF subfamily)